MEGNAHAGTFNDGRAESAESGLVDSVRSAASSAVDKGQDALAAVRDGAAGLPGMLADKLEAGADSIRPEHQPPTALGAGTLVNHSQVTQVTDKLATGMQAGADWLRNADLNRMRDAVEAQVKEKPAQSLLIALGVGYMLGKAVRR
jgi:hypothetical protein